MTTNPNSAQASGKGLTISTKHSIEVSNALRGKMVKNAKIILERAIIKQTPIEFKTYTNGIGHRKGNLMAGCYPVKACTAILTLLKSAEANAQAKGLNTSTLKIAQIIPNKATTVMRGGRHGGKAKRTHITIILTETQEAQPNKNKKIQAKQNINQNTQSKITSTTTKITPEIINQTTQNNNIKQNNQNR